jgi:integrase
MAMILIAYRHGLRASELVNLRWSDIDLECGTLYCPRAKGSRSSVHPLKRDEATALERVLRVTSARTGDYVFRSECGERMSRCAFWRVVAQVGERAGLAVHAYAHLLRPAAATTTQTRVATCGWIQDYLGHKQIQHTVRYTALNPARFAGLW